MSLGRFHFQDIENTGSMWIDAGDSWAARSSWDNTISGEATVCVYNSSDLFDNVCSEVRASFFAISRLPYMKQSIKESTARNSFSLKTCIAVSLKSDMAIY